MSYIETIYIETSPFKTNLRLLEAFAIHFEGRRHFPNKIWPY